MLGYYFTDPTHKLEDIDLRSFFANMSDERRERYWNLEERYGTISPREDNVFVEAGQAFMGGVVGALEGVGATANELGLGSGMQDYFRGVLNRNQQWNAPENMSVATYIARAVGNAGGSMAGQAAANYAGTVIGTAATGNPVAGRIIGFGSGLTVGFAQTFGNNVQRNREAGYGEGKSYGMAFLESTIDSTIENLPFGIVGKSGKLATNAGRVMRISQAGKSELLKLVGKKMSAEIGQKATQNFLFQWGKKTIKDGLGEAGEEGLQYLNSYVNQKLGGDPNAEFSINELADAIAQGFIGGFILGGPRNISEVRQENRRRSTPATNQSTVGASQTPVPAVAGVETTQTTPAENNVVDNDQPLFDTLITDVGNALGINIDFMDSRPDGAELEKENNGIYDKKNKTLYLNRNTYSVNPAETLGHELKHYIDDNIPELSKAFNSLLEAGKTEAGKQEVSEIAREFGITEAEGNVEFSADMFGKLFARPETWQKMAAQLDERTPGMGEKFLQTLRDFYALVKTKLADLVGTNPEAETFLNNVTKLENEAARMLAELHRRNGNSTQVENVVGAKGNTAVETVPVSAINVDAARFQIQEELKNIVRPTAERRGVTASDLSDTAHEIDYPDGNIGERFDAHGIAKGKLSEQLQALLNLLDNGIDPNKTPLYTAPFTLSEENREAGAGMGTATNGAYKDGLAVVLSDAGKTINDDGIKIVFINDAVSGIIPLLQQRYPGVEFHKLSENKRVLKNRMTPAGQVVSETEKTTDKNGQKPTETDNDVISVENAQTTPAKSVEEKQTETAEPIPPSAEKSSGDSNNALQKMRNAFDNRVEIRNSTSKQMPWTDIAREYADGKVLSKEADDLIINEIADMSMEDYQNSEVNNILHAIASNPIHSVRARSRAKSALKSIEKKRLGFAGAITLDSTKTVAEMIAEDENLWEQEKKRYPDTDPSKSVFKQRLDYLKSLSEKEIVEHDVLVKEEKGETAATPEVKSAYANLKDRSAEIGLTFDQFYEKFAPQLDAIIAKASNQIRTLGDEITDDWRSAAYEAMAKAYMGYNPQSGVKISTYATKAVVNAINEVNRKHKAETISRGGRVSLDQTNEQGEALSEAVADKNETIESDSISSRENPQEAKRRITESKKLSPVQKQIVDLFNQDLSPSEVIRKLGKRFGEEGHEYMSKEEFQHQIVAIRTIAEEEGVLYSRKRGQSIQKRDATLTEVAKLNMRNEVSRVIETGIPEGKYVFKNLDDKQKTIDGAIKFLKEFSRKIVPLSDGRIAYFMPDERAFERGSATAWAEYGIHAVTSSGKQIPGKEYKERLFNQNKLDNLDRIIPIIQQENVFGKFDNKNPAKDGVIFVGTSHDGKRLEVITRLDEYGNPQADLTEVTVLATNKESNIPPHKPLSEVVEAVAQHQAAGFSPSTNNTIPQSGEKSSADLEFSRKRLHQQINPIVRDGKVRDEYADLLANKEYTPTTLKELQDKALEWILRRGGIVKAVQDILANKAPADPAVAEIARRFILNSDVFVNGVEYKDRIKLYSLEQNTRSNWGRAGRAMQLAALSLKDVASVQALLNKLHKDIPPADLQKLRNDIMKNLGIDIFNLPKDIVNDKSKLDALLRAELAHKAKWHDKLYEYWINAILSGPGTHISNFFGNTANAVYELGIKRFTEALVNIAAGRKDGATFGEFKAMIKAFNWSNACKAFAEAKNIEVLDPSGKFLENNLVAIGGKTGRIIRYPGRFLKAADAFAKALIQPMETAAYAYRMGVQKGLTGTKLQEYIQDQLTDKDSKAYQWANERAKELTFQEDPGSAVKWLMAMKESDGAMGIILKMFLPFLKTPANILRQGVRKGPLGIFNLAWETGKLALGKRDFDGQYVARVAEQLLAWGAVMLFLGLDDEDDLPFITGSSAPYGSAEYGFKGNKIPPYSIRIGGSYYSYQRIEPFATSLALIADGIQALRNIKNGKDGTAVLNDVWRGAKQIVVDKSFFSTLGEINTALTSPDYIFRPVNNVVSGFVPKVVSQPLQALVPEVGESKSRNKGLDFIEDQFFLILNRAGIMAAIPKVDYFGRDLQKDDWGDSFLSALGRLTSLKRITPDSHMDQAERLIWNYNQKNPDSEYYPSIPQHTFTYEGEQYYLAGKDYHDFAVEAGELAHRQILNAVNAGRLNVTNPSEQDIELIKNIFTRARRETRQKYINRAKRQR